MQLSRRVNSLKESSTLAVTARAKAMRAQGIDVLPFAAGEPDFDTPEPIKAAAIAALRAGQTRYMPTAGDAETRTVIAEKLGRDNGIPCVTPQHVVITAGGKHALYMLFQALLEEPAPGKAPWEVLLPVPAWVSYDPLARLAGGRVVELPTDAAGDFKITPAQLEAAVTPRSRVLVINSPSNPCGTMYTPGELRALASAVQRAARVSPELMVISDEIYEKIVYGGVEHFSIGSVPAIAERTVTVNGLSKAYAMTGWRVGYFAGSGANGRRLAEAVARLEGQMVTNITSFVYPAIRTALTECAGEVEAMRAAFGRRAALVSGLLGGVPGLVFPRPTGAFYVFPDVSAYFGMVSPGGRVIDSGLTMAGAILEEARVAVVPGEDFGGSGGRHVRISFACSDEQIVEGMRRLSGFFASLKKA